MKAAEDLIDRARLEHPPRRAGGHAPVRILYVQPNGERMGHYGSWTCNFCQALARAGHAVTVLTPGLTPENYLGDPPLFEIIEVGGGANDIAMTEIAGGRFSFRFAARYSRRTWMFTRMALALARRRGFDVVHVHGGEFGTLAWAATIFGRGRPPIVTDLFAANFSMRTYAAPWPLRLYKALQQRMLRAAFGRGLQGLTLLGEYGAAQLRNQLGLPAPGVCEAVIHDGGDTPREVISSAQARSELGLPQATTLFLYFGQFRRDKGWETLVEAFAEGSDPTCKLVMAGHCLDTSREEVITRIKESGVADRIIFHLEYVPESHVDRYFYAADAVVLPYSRHYRGGSGPFLRGACAHQRPSLVTSVGEMARWVAAEQCGLLCSPDDPRSLAECLRRFLSLSTAERNEMAARAFAIAQKHTWSHMADTVSGLYHQVLGN